MSITELPRHPWLDALLADPVRAVADLLSGRADKYPYARLRDAEFLHQVLPTRAGLEQEYSSLENGLLTWFAERRREDWRARTRLGLPAYVMALIEALSAVQMLELSRVAETLREQHNAYLRWLEPLRLGRAADPALELWRSHALLPDDNRFLPQWMRFCIEADNTRPATYLTVALQGLRELPNNGDVALNLRYILRGLAERYLANLHRDKIDEEIKFHFSALRGAYPYLNTPNTWHELWNNQVLIGLTRSEDDAVRCLLGNQPDDKGRKPESKKRQETTLDPSRFTERAKELAEQMRTAKAVESLWPRVENLIHDTLKYCRLSADSYHFVRSLCNLGDKQLKRSHNKETTAHALLRWLPDALQWGRDNPHVWMLWAQCLEEIGAEEHAESVYWEMRRYFPDNEPCRTKLASLLMCQERNVEAEALLREAAERNPNHEPSRTELARLSRVKGKEYFPDAERWLREVVDRHPNDEHSRVELAKLLTVKGKEHFAEVEVLLREAAERNPNHVHSRVELARLLMVKGKGKEHFAEAEVLLRKAAERDPNHAHSRVELARLLSLSGKNNDAIALLEGFAAKHLKDKYVQFNLQLLRDGRSLNFPQLGGEEHEQEASTPVRKMPSVLDISSVSITALPDAMAQAAARATRAAFRMALQDHLAQQGRAELTQALADDPDDLLAAFYLDWAQSLPEDYAAPPDAYALAAAHSYRRADDGWEDLVKGFPEQRRLTWGLRWLAALRDGSELPAQDYKQLKKLTQRLSDEGNPDVARKQHVLPIHAAGEEIVARLWQTLSHTETKPDTDYLDRQAQALIALTINRNLNPVAITY